MNRAQQAAAASPVYEISICEAVHYCTRGCPPPPLSHLARGCMTDVLRQRDGRQPADAMSFDSALGSMRLDSPLPGSLGFLEGPWRAVQQPKRRRRSQPQSVFNADCGHVQQHTSERPATRPSSPHGQKWAGRLTTGERKLPPCFSVTIHERPPTGTTTTTAISSPLAAAAQFLK